MDCSFESNCPVTTIDSATASPLIASCHCALSKSTVARGTFRRAECECYSVHSVRVLSYARAHRRGNHSHEQSRIGAGRAADLPFGLRKDVVARVDLRHLACRFASQPKILPHYRSLDCFHCRRLLAEVAHRWLRSSRRHPSRVIQWLLLLLLSTKHQSRALHIESQQHLHPLRLGPHPCQRLPGRHHSLRQLPPASRKRFWETSSRHRETSQRRRLGQIQFGRGR